MKALHRRLGAVLAVLLSLTPPLQAHALLCRYTLDISSAAEFRRHREGSRSEILEYADRRLPPDAREALRSFVLHHIHRDANALATPELSLFRTFQVRAIEGVRAPRLISEWDFAVARTMREMAIEKVEHRFGETIRRLFENRPSERSELLTEIAIALQVESHLPRRHTRMSSRLNHARFTVLGILANRDREILRSLDLDRPVKEALRKGDLAELDTVVARQLRGRNEIARAVNTYNWFTSSISLAIVFTLMWEINRIIQDDPGLPWSELTEAERTALPALVDRLQNGRHQLFGEALFNLERALSSSINPRQKLWLERRLLSVTHQNPAPEE